MLQSKSYSLDKKFQTDRHTYTGQKHALVYFTNINMGGKNNSCISKED